MAKNYSEGGTSLRELVDAGSRDSGATLLIPDLQRPFVWTPSQVILLVDSLLRGWPFGTLLLWSVKNEELGIIPHRPFWKVVDRTNESLERVSPAIAPATFKMVLDGQQRLQSLLLAFGGDEWGFKLTDKEWSEDLERQRSRVRNPHRHWSQGQLYLDLTIFDEKASSVGNARKVEFRDVLVWAIGKQDGGQSVSLKAANGPLKRVFDPENLGRFVRLGRLWAMAKPNTSEKEYRDKLTNFLSVHSVSSALIGSVIHPLAEVMVTLNEAKEATVAYLELAARRDDDDAEIYNDAIVNIFTRLNTAGRALTRQEITFAWIKQGWDPARTDGNGAVQCFDKLREEIAQQNFEIDLDELVRVVAGYWATIHNGGNLLGPKDLLRGDKIRPMAENLVDAWKSLHQDLIDFCAILDSEDLRLRDVYVSLNAAILLATFWGLLRRWGRSRPLSVVDSDSFKKGCDTLLRQRADRWLLCSQWAGLWGSSNDQSFAQYILELSNLWRRLEILHDPDSVLEAVAAKFDDWLRKLVPDASEYVDKNLEVDKRQFVNTYRTLIWIWLRLDSQRWEMASIPLRIGNRQSPTLHVDHLVPVKIWEDMGAREEGNCDEEATTSVPAHAIGNCLLLESSFNISKGGDELETFLTKVHEFRTGERGIEEWCTAMAIPKELRNPKDFSVDAVIKAVDVRTEEIKAELLEYVDGRKSRVDRSDQNQRHIGKFGSPTPTANATPVFHPLRELPTEAQVVLGISDASLQILSPWRN